MTAIFTAFSTAAASIALPFIPVFDTYHPFIKGIVIGLIPVVAFTSIARVTLWVCKNGEDRNRQCAEKIIQLLCLFLFFNGTHLNWTWLC